MAVAAALLAAALAVGPGCGAAVGSLTLIGSSAEAVATVVKSGAPAADDTLKIAEHSGG